MNRQEAQKRIEAIEKEAAELKKMVGEDVPRNAEPVVRCFDTGETDPFQVVIRKFFYGKCTEAWLCNGEPASKEYTARGCICSFYTEFPPEEWDDRVAELLEMNTNCPVCGSDVSLDFSFARCNNGGLRSPWSRLAIRPGGHQGVPTFAL